MPQDWDDFKGRVKEATGDLTEDDELKREGKIDQIKADIDNAVDEFTDKVKGLFGKN